jgi:hypothetical protein
VWWEVPVKGRWRRWHRETARITSAAASSSNEGAKRKRSGVAAGREGRGGGRKQSKRKNVMTRQGVVTMGMQIEVYFEEDALWHRGVLRDAQENLDWWLGKFDDGMQHWIDVRVVSEWRRVTGA